MQPGPIIHRTRNFLLRRGWWLGLVLLAGCQRDEIRVYEVSKEQQRPSKPRSQEEVGPIPTMKWASLPEGWEPQPPPNQMRAASFVVHGPAGKMAELSVIPLPGMGGSDLDFVNMWRKQIGLDEVDAARLPQYVQPIQVAGQDGKLFDMRGSEGAKSTDPNGVLVATLVRAGVTWFFKLAGDETLVLSQRKNLQDFLAGVRFEDPPQGASMASAPFAGGGGAGARGGSSSEGSIPKPAWDVPASWQEAPPGPMLLAKFRANGAGDDHADVNISAIPGNGGGLLMNVNRWRGQMGLGQLDAAALSKETTSLELEGKTATALDISGTDGKTGQPSRLVGVVFPRDGETWFYKLMGSPSVVAREKEAFLKFVQTARYPHAP